MKRLFVVLFHLGVGRARPVDRANHIACQRVGAVAAVAAIGVVDREIRGSLVPFKRLFGIFVGIICGVGDGFLVRLIICMRLKSHGTHTQRKKKFTYFIQSGRLDHGFRMTSFSCVKVVIKGSLFNGSISIHSPLKAFPFTFKLPILVSNQLARR